MPEVVDHSQIYLDSNVFIDLIEGVPSLADPMKRFFSLIQGRPKVACTSEIALAEVLAPSGEAGARSASLRRRYFQLMVWNPSISLRPVTRSVLYDTVELRKFTGHKLPDAIHCATAIQGRCRFLMSRDQRMTRLPREITYLAGQMSDVETFAEALGA